MACPISPAASPKPIRTALPHRGQGKVADYIPALAGVDPDRFGFALALPDGTVHTAGDADEAFSIQSVSKVFTLALALRRVGSSLWDSVGREPSGSAFNSIVQLESEQGCRAIRSSTPGRSRPPTG